MSSVNKFIAVASLFTAVSLFSQVYSCHYWLIGRLTINRHVISFFHSPVLLYAVLAFHSVNRCDLYFFQCFLSLYTQYLWPNCPIRPISPMQYFYGPAILQLSTRGTGNTVCVNVTHDKLTTCQIFR